MPYLKKEIDDLTENTNPPYQEVLSGIEGISLGTFQNLRLRQTSITNSPSLQMTNLDVKL
jgi:hypothetical protein